MIREAHAASTESATTGTPIDEVTAMRAERAREARRTVADVLVSRRSVLMAGVATGVLAATGGATSLARAAVLNHASPSSGAGSPASGAPISCGRSGRSHLTVYEWDDRVGGRVETLRGYFANGQIVEQHGEFISSEHISLDELNLASSLGLSLTSPPPPPPIQPARRTPTGSTVRGTRRPCSMPIGRPSRGRHSTTPSTRRREQYDG